MDDTADSGNPGLILLGDTPVMLDARVAQGFGVAVRAINQAVARNPAKFDARHCWRLTPAQWDGLKSQDVIPKAGGRGGPRVPPSVYTQTGVAGLATVLTSARALDFADAMIDLFVDIHRQLAAGATGRPFPPRPALSGRRMRR